MNEYYKKLILSSNNNKDCAIAHFVLEQYPDLYFCFMVNTLNLGGTIRTSFFIESSTNEALGILSKPLENCAESLPIILNDKNFREKAISAIAEKAYSRNN